MSSLRVLTLGNNPNIPLYTSRFQAAKSVELFHVSDSESNVFQLETFRNGTEQFEVANHFTSLDSLASSLEGQENCFFDLVILSASSLQELSSVVSKLGPLINTNTKMFLESSGFVQLEPFVKMSMDSSQLSVFSIISDFDIREIAPNRFKQFPTNNSSVNGATIYLGDSSASKIQQQQSGFSHKYPKNICGLLDTFKRLFQKLFPKETIDLCNYSSLEFLSQQWTFAIPHICFDPLLIMLEETDPNNLHNQILAKPLISGLVTETVTVAKNMGVKLQNNLDNENSLLQYWQNQYQSDDETPALVYHFLHKTAPLNIDLVVLQIILLADDFSIKTPYLEFLYSLLCQYQKLNDGTSKWFMRKQDTSKSDSKLISLENENSRLMDTLHEKEEIVKSLQNKEYNYKGTIENSQNQLTNLNEQLSTNDRQHQEEVRRLEAKLQNTSLNVSNNSPSRQMQTASSAVQQLKQDEYKVTGTPNLKDLEDFAVHNVNYGESPSHQQQLQPPHSQSQSQSSLAGQTSSHRSGSSDTSFDNDTTLKERELELRKKELELQERELEMQKRAMQQQQFQQQARYSKMPNGAMNQSLPPLQQQPPPQMMNSNNRKSSYPQLQQPSNIRTNRSMHGIPASAGNFVDPISSGGRSHSNNNIAGYGQQQMPLQNPTITQQQHGHSIKPTSRKNRNSNMPNLGYASSMGFNNFVRPSTNGNSSQSRLNSMSS